jgi:hypothetical protein
MHLLDLNRLAQLSGNLHSAAGDVGVLGSSLRSGAAGLRWRSPAARVFQTTLHEVLLQLSRTGGRISELASALERHRSRAADRAAELASALKLAAGPVTGTAERLIRLR